MSVVMIFLDGVGIGVPDPVINPLYSDKLEVFPSLLGITPSLFPVSMPGSRGSMRELDANLGVAGLPQSGTGQATLFTGVNASALLGRHFGPYPHSTLRPLLNERNIFAQLQQAGKSCCFANAFPQRFFTHIEDRPSRVTVTTLACRLSGIPLRTADDLIEGRAVSADITSEGWPELGYPSIPSVEPEESGRRLRSLAMEYDFVLFEYWKTDHAGHSMGYAEAIDVLVPLDRMLRGFLESESNDDILLLITSDHGNIEDITTKVHTRNPVPLVVYGKGHHRMEQILGSPEGSDLSCVTPAVVRYLLNESGD